MKMVTSFEYSPTPEELATEFCGLSQDGQSKFLNRVAEIFDDLDCLAMQLEYISQCKLLTNGARDLMHMIGDYAEHNT